MKRLLLLLTALVCLCAGQAALSDGANLLRNGDFSDLAADGLPAAWTPDAWLTAEGYTIYSAGAAPDASHWICVNNIGLNDARFRQTVRVQPETLYCLSGDIRADGIEDQGWGANLSVSDLYASSEAFFDTEGE